jgi:conjugal transfer pilin signal peptidase TrbI
MIGVAKYRWGFNPLGVSVPLWRKCFAAVMFLFVLVGLYVLAFGSVVLNGTSSLSHNGYFMLRWPIIPVRGAYMSFEAPAAIAPEYTTYSFVKRIVGLPGDRVRVEGAAVCVADVCRVLLHDLVERGVGPLEAGVIPPGHYFVLGDADNSLDSRYAPIGLIAHSSIEAVGLPVPIPHWKEIHSWFSHD